MIINLSYDEVSKILEEYYKDKFDKRYKVSVNCGVKEIVYPDRPGMCDGYTEYVPYGVIKLSTEIEKEDIFITSHTDYVGDTDYYYTFECPICNRKTDIEERKIPYAIRIEKLNDYKGSYTRRREWR